MMKQTVLLAVACVSLFGQASPVVRMKSYAGTPTAGDCNTNTIGVLVAINTTPDPDTLHDCLDVSSTPTWVARGSSAGTVTSVDLSMPNIFSVSGNPVTTSGTLAVTLATQTANKVLASATSGGAATPAFRALVAADIPDLSGTYQPLDADLTTIGGLSPSRGGVIRRGASAWENVALGSTGALFYSDGTDAVWLARVSAAGTIDFASLNDGACLENTFTLTGASLGDPIALGVATALPAGVVGTARVSAADTAQIQICNMSGAAVDLSSRSWTARIVR